MYAHPEEEWNTNVICTHKGHAGGEYGHAEGIGPLGALQKSLGTPLGPHAAPLGPLTIGATKVGNMATKGGNMATKGE